VIVLELFVLNWRKTTVNVVFVQRGWSALSDLAFTVVYFTPLKWISEYTLSFGLAFGIAKLMDALTVRLDWARWELPSDGVLQVIAAFSVYYLLTTFIGYWHHRLLHWRWFWYLHRYHHSASEFNIFTGFRENPAASFINVLPALSPLILMKVPTTGLFGAFFIIYQMISSLQHSQLPWGFGWIGRWIIVSPQNHQIHHSVDEEHRDQNFSVCPLWDHLFGTWYAGANRPSVMALQIGRMSSGPSLSGSATSGFSIGILHARWPASLGRPWRVSGGRDHLRKMRLIHQPQFRLSSIQESSGADAFSVLVAKPRPNGFPRLSAWLGA